MRLHYYAGSMFLALVAPLAAPAAPSNAELLQSLLARMDKAAGEFQAMTAQVTDVTHTDVLNEDNTESGAAVMKKVAPGEVQGRVDFTAPDQRSIAFEKRRIKRYYPKIKRVEVFDLEKHGPQLDKFVLIGFGISGAELERDYTLSVVGTETVKGTRAIHLLLIPKAGEAKQYVKTLELWIPEQGDPYPLSEKILQPSGDYQIINYGDLKINPSLAPDAVQLKLPAGVETVYPGK